MEDENLIQKRTKVYRFWKNSDEEIERKYGPACIYNEGIKIWMIKYKNHRLDAPASIESNGKKIWFVDNICIKRQISL